MKRYEYDTGIVTFQETSVWAFSFCSSPASSEAGSPFSSAEPMVRSNGANSNGKRKSG